MTPSAGLCAVHQTDTLTQDVLRSFLSPSLSDCSHSTDTRHASNNMMLWREDCIVKHQDFPIVRSGLPCVSEQQH